MSQGKLSFKTTKQSRRAPIKNVDVVANETVRTLRSSEVQSPGNKRKYVSSPESSSPVSKPPKTGHSRVKREQKRVKHTRATHNACKTLFDYVNTEKTEKESVKQIDETGETDKPEPVKKKPESQKPTQNAAEPESVKSETAVNLQLEREGEEEIISPEPVPVKCEDKSTQNDDQFSAKSFLKKMAQPREEPVEVKNSYKTNGGKMLAAALAKRKPGVPAHKNEVIRALAARRELCVRTPSLPSSSTESTPSLNTADKSHNAAEKTLPGKPAEKLSARDRFAHLIKPTSPKIKPFKSITISSPTKSPLKDQADLSLPETYKRLHDKFNTSDQVLNLLARRQETCTFQKLQRNVQEICRKRFTEGDLGTAVGVYKEAYILAQCKGLSQIKNDRNVRNEYQLTISFNYKETEDIKKAHTTDIMGLHPTLNTKRELNFTEEEDSNKLSENERISLSLMKEKHAFNQRGLLSAELLERSKRFQKKLLKYVHAAHQLFLSTLVPALSIEPSKLTRWHPEFDLNGLDLPAPAELPKPPVSSRILSVGEMLEQIDSNKALPPPGMQEAVEKNMEKVLSEKKEVDKKKEDQLKNLNPALVARIRAKEAKKVAQQMTRDPEKDKELAMIERLEPIVRCLRVLYVSAGKGSMLLNDVTQDIASNPRMTMSQLSVQEHVKLLVKICPTWLTIVNLRKKEYLKLNRNVDTNIVLDAVKNKQNQLMS